jgi:hypothetical protein
MKIDNGFRPVVEFGSAKTIGGLSTADGNLMLAIRLHGLRPPGVGQVVRLDGKPHRLLVRQPLGVKGMALYNVEPCDEEE